MPVASLVLCFLSLYQVLLLSDTHLYVLYTIACHFHLVVSELFFSSIKNYSTSLFGRDNKFHIESDKAKWPFFSLPH